MSTSTASATTFLRRGLLAIAALTTAGVTVELAVERHWTQPIQLVAWAAVAALAVAIILVWGARSAARIQIARLLAAAVVLSAIVGLGAHTYANYDAGALDRRYASTWETLPDATRWVLAITKSVGPSPPFAPGALAEAALMVLLATWQHPAITKEASTQQDQPA